MSCTIKKGDPGFYKWEKWLRENIKDQYVELLNARYNDDKENHSKSMILCMVNLPLIHF